MGRLLGGALAQQRFDEAQSLLQPLNEFWRSRGLRQEAQGWFARCRAALEDRRGTPPDLTSEAGALWLFAVGAEAFWVIQAGELEEASRIYDAIRQRLEASPESEQKQRRLAVAYHQLGMVAQDRGDLAAAEGWYRKSLEINEALGNRPGLASSYGQLGLLAEAREDLAAALDWTVRCVALFDQFPHPATGPAPQHLARLTASLGLPALEASWQRCAGRVLPEPIRNFVANSPRE
jgi:tetratricopeptide (TPR) repeat protein